MKTFSSQHLQLWVCQGKVFGPWAAGGPGKSICGVITLKTSGMGGDS